MTDAAPTVATNHRARRAALRLLSVSSVVLAVAWLLPAEPPVGFAHHLLVPLGLGLYLLAVAAFVAARPTPLAWSALVGAVLASALRTAAHAYATADAVIPESLAPLLATGEVIGGLAWLALLSQLAGGSRLLVAATLG